MEDPHAFFERVSDEIDDAIIDLLGSSELRVMDKKSKEKKFTVTRTVTKEITRCYHSCPYFDTEGGPGPVMICTHPQARDRYIISHPECSIGFPKDCPLLHQVGEVKDE